MNADMRRKTVVYLIIRIVIINAIIAFLYFMNPSPSLSRTVFLAVLVSVNSLFFAALLILRYLENLKVFLYAHFIFDVFLITGLSFFDGGVMNSDMPLPMPHLDTTSSIRNTR